MAILDSSDLATYIDDNNINAEIISLPVKTLTVAAAAEALDVSTQQIIKSVLFLADGSPVLVISNGLTRINRKRLGSELGMSRRKVKMADKEIVLSITGYPVGAVPPIGHKEEVPVLLDQGVFEETEIYGGGGAVDALMKISTTELQRVINGRLVDIADR